MMKLKFLTSGLMLLTALFFSVKGQPPVLPGVKSGIKTEIVLNKVTEHAGSDRKLYVLIAENDFSLENVRKLFAEYRAQYAEPKMLRIFLDSDRAMLQRMINFEKQPMTIEFSESEAGRAASSEFYQRYYPLPTGYFRAEFARYSDYEYFDYSPQKEFPQTIRLILKPQVKRLTAMAPERAIFEAVESGDIEAAKAILANSKFDLNLKNKDGGTPMIHAAGDGNVEIVKLLAAAGSSLTARSTGGVSPIDIAARYRQTATVKMLLETGVSANLKTAEGYTPILFAVEHPEIETTKLLIETGATVNNKTETGVTALMAAGNSAEIVELLLKAGAKPEETTNDGQTAVFFAVRNAAEAKLEALLKKGARVNLRDKQAMTPLMMAEQIEDAGKKERIVNLLTAFRANE